LYDSLGKNTKTILTVSLAAVIVSMVAGNSMAYAADFSGDYDKANWDLILNGGSGSVDLNLAVDTIELTGSDSGALGDPFDTDFSITVPCDTTISFDWDYASVDDTIFGLFDSASFVNDGVVTFLAEDPPASGSVAEPAFAGDIFAFRVNTEDNFGGPGILTITNFDAGDPCPETDIQVDVDIKPGSDPNCIKDTSRGFVPVSILGSADLDVTDIDTGTLEIGDDDDSSTPPEVAPTKTSIKDVNSDGFDDLNLKFKTVELAGAGLLTENNELFVTGELLDATPISGSDIINLAGGPNCFDQ